MIKQLFLRQGIPSRPENNVDRTVDRGAVLRGEQIHQHIVDHHEHGGEAQHEFNVAQPYAGDPEKHKACQSQRRQQPRVIGRHGGKAPQQKTYQLGRAGQIVDRGGAVDVIEQIRHGRITSRS